MVTKVDDSSASMYRGGVTLSTPRSIAQQIDDIACGRYDVDENPHMTIQRLAALVRDDMLSRAHRVPDVLPGDGVMPCVRGEA